MERLEHVAGSQGPQGKQGTNTQEIERDRSADQAGHRLARPRRCERERAASLHLFISFFLWLFVDLLLCLFVACYNVAINPPKESRNAPC